MRCPSCATENEAGRKFCHECGTGLSSACPTCGATNPPGAKFCGDCGGRLVEGSAQHADGPGSDGGSTEPATERRTVSVLFADLVGFTTLAEGLDPEDLRVLQDRYFATARAVIERYGGTVEKFIGDAVMAVWGAPATHEDDPERAVRSALELIGAVSAIAVGDRPETLVARAAVMTGEAAVAIGAVGHALVTGDLVSSASRLQGSAEPGTVLIDEPTHRATAEAIASEPLGPQALRGRAEPVEAWRASHALALVGGRRRSRQVEPPFVGRDAELRLLKDVLHAVDEDSRARLVSVTGLAGIGKSRLSWELEKYIDGIVHDVYWHQGRSPAYGEGVAYWALAEMIRGRAGIAETDDPGTSRAKLADTLAEHLPDESERRATGPLLLALLGLEPPAEGRHDETLAAARRLFERIAERGVVVLVFEDLQWADMGLIDFIESILEWSRNHRILVVTLARPELLDRRPTWGARLRNFTALHLEPISDEAMTQLLDGVAPGLPRPFVRRILERAAGIPLFAVETIRMLVAEGRLLPDGDRYRLVGDLGPIAVPDSLRGVVGARIDALGVDERALLQDAAVLGQTFTLDALEALSGRPPTTLEAVLGDLVRREILARDDDPRSPERGQYAFVQGVIREVVYDTLAKRDRRTRHLAVARYYETLESDELAGVLASHYLDAYRATGPGPEADALAAQARVALRAAADRAMALGSYELAMRYLEQALDVAGDDAERAALRQAAASAAYQAARFEDAHRLGTLAFEYHRSAGNLDAIAQTAVLLSRTESTRGRMVEARQIVEEARAECADLAGVPAAVELLAEAARLQMIGYEPEATETADQALIAAEALGLLPIAVDAMVTKAGALGTAGRNLEATALLRGAIQLAAANGLVETQLRGTTNLAVQLWADDLRSALGIHLEAIELARRTGHVEAFAWAMTGAAWTLEWLGSWNEALDLVAELDAIEALADDPSERLATRAVIAAYRGEETLARETLAAAEATQPPVSRSETLAGQHLNRADLAALSGDLDLATTEALTAARIAPFAFTREPATRFATWAGDVDALREALELLRTSYDGHGRYADALREAAEAGLAALEGHLDVAVTGYRRASATLRQLDTPLMLGFCLMSQALRTGPTDPAARTAADEAREIFERLGSPPLVALLEEGLRRQLAGSAHGAPDGGSAGRRPDRAGEPSNGSAEVAATES